MSSIEIALPKRQTLLRSTTLVSMMTLISRVAGFFRDMLMAQLFGAQAGMDAFYVAFRIPNFMRRLFSEGAFSQAFVPVLAEYQKQRSFHEVREFIGRVGGQLGLTLSIVTFFGMLAAPLIITLFAPGFGADSMRSIWATEMLRLTFPFLMLISLTGMAGAVLNTYGYFGVPAITPVILNIVMILAALYIAPYCNPPVVGLAWGVLIAGFVQFFFQIPFLYRRKLLVRPKLVWQDEGVKRVLKLMAPALFGVSVAQINLMIDSIFASFLKVGSVTWLYYTDRLTDFPLGVFGVAIATVILPHLSRRFSEQSTEKYSRSLDWALRLILLIGIPSGLGLALFSMPLIAGCFTYGEFSTYDLMQTQKSLIALSLGVPAFMLVKVLASGFYARQDIRTPVKVGAYAMVVNSIFCLLLIKHFAHAGLALASTLASYFNCAVLIWILKRRGIYQPSPYWLRFFIQLVVANLMIGVFWWFIRTDVTFWLAKPAITRLSLLLAFVLSVSGVYLISLWVLGIRLADFRGKHEDKIASTKKEQSSG